jgi:hypothetical protein
MTKLRPPRPSASMIVAIIALVAALGGTSYAAFSLPANSVGSKQLKKNAVTTKKIKNGAVTASKINPAGLTVPNASHASNATNAGNAAELGGKAASTYAQNGATLPSGVSERGVWSVVTTAGGSGESSAANISFPIALASNPTAHYVPLGSAPPSGCSGTVTAPAAAPGNLCVFERFSAINLTQLNFYNPENGSETATASGQTGDLVVFVSNGAGTAQAAGTWAVAAP